MSKFLDLVGLAKYDEKIKEYIGLNIEDIQKLIEIAPIQKTEDGEPILDEFGNFILVSPTYDDEIAKLKEEKEDKLTVAKYLPILFTEDGYPILDTDGSYIFKE